MQAKDVTLKELISNQYFEIPFFQRSYVWEKEQWNQFLEDILDVSNQKDENPYFIGNLIIKEEEGHVFKVIDGQQRLTTIMLFLKAYTRRGKDKLSDDSIDKYFYHTDHTEMTGDDKLVRLQHNWHDKEIFEAIINLEEGEDLSKELQDKYKNNNILQCYQFFMSQKASNYGFESDKKTSVLYRISFEKISSKIQCILIKLYEYEDEQQIFHSINAKSVPLEGSDILKNILFSRKQQEFYKETWFAEFEKDEKATEYWIGGKSKEKKLDIFLNAYLTVESEGRYNNIKELFKSYSKYFREQGKKPKPDPSIVEDIVEKAKIFRKNFIPIQKMDETLVLNASNRISILLVIKQRIHLSFVYYLLIRFEDGEIEEKEKMIRLIESYFIRSIVSVSERGKNIRFNIFNKGKLIKNKVSNQSKLFEALRWDNESMPSDEEFKEAFEKMKCTDTQTHKNLVKCLLYFIERHLVEKANQKVHVSFEDLKVTSHLTTKIKDLQKSGLSEEEIEEKLTFVCTIGNWKLECKGKTFYSNGDYFSNNREQETDQEAILARSEWLAEIACEIWKTNYTDEDVAYVDNE